MTNKKEIAIIGGAGHISTPGIRVIGFKTTLIDKNKKNIELINDGTMPFLKLGEKY